MLKHYKISNIIYNGKNFSLNISIKENSEGKLYDRILAIGAKKILKKFKLDNSQYENILNQLKNRITSGNSNIIPVSKIEGKVNSDLDFESKKFQNVYELYYGLIKEYENKNN